MADDTQLQISISDIIAEGAKGIALNKIKEAPFDKSYYGTISAILFKPNTDRKSVDFGRYKVRYKTEEKIVRINDGLIHNIGERVRIYIFENNLENIYVEPLITRILPKTITYTDGTTTKNSITQDLVTTVKETIVNGKTYTLTDVFKINIKNKDTTSEEIVSMIMPDETQINFVGW